MIKITCTETIVVEQTASNEYTVNRQYNLSNERPEDQRNKAGNECRKLLTKDELKAFLEFHRNAQRVDIMEQI